MATQGRYAIFNESSLNNAQNNEFILNNCLVIIDEVLHVKENGEFKPLQCVFGTYPFADQALSTKVLYIDVDGERFYKYNGSDFDTFYPKVIDSNVENTSNVVGSTLREALNALQENYTYFNDFSNSAVVFGDWPSTNPIVGLSSSYTIDGAVVGVYTPRILVTDDIPVITNALGDGENVVGQNYIEPSFFGGANRSFSKWRQGESVTTRLGGTFKVSFQATLRTTSTALLTNIRVGICRFNGAENSNDFTIEEFLIQKENLTVVDSTGDEIKTDINFDCLFSLEEGEEANLIPFFTHRSYNPSGGVGGGVGDPGIFTIQDLKFYVYKSL